MEFGHNKIQYSITKLILNPETITRQNIEMILNHILTTGATKYILEAASLEKVQFVAAGDIVHLLYTLQDSKCFRRNDDSVQQIR